MPPPIRKKVTLRRSDLPAELPHVFDASWGIILWKVQLSDLSADNVPPDMELAIGEPLPRCNVLKECQRGAAGRSFEIAPALAPGDSLQFSP